MKLNFWPRLGALLLLSSLGASPRAAAAAATPLENLVYQADHVLRGKTTAAMVTMHIKTQSYERSYSMVYFADERGGSSRALVKILGPARWRGHGTLKVGERLSVYDPSSDRVTVLSGSMLDDNWMGSHFTNDDLVKDSELARDYHARELTHWAASVEGKEATFYRLLLEPTPTAPVPWDHQVLELYTQGKTVVPVRQEYFPRKEQPAPTRTLTFDSVKDMGGRTVPTRLVMRVAEPAGDYTELVYVKAKFDADVPTGKFTEQALRQ